MTDWRAIQQALRDKGFDPGAVDGIPGPRTDAAIIAFKKSKGLVARPYLGPITLGLLLGTPAASTAAPSLPWMNEIAKYMGAHEVRDFTRLFNWLRLDGGSVGDPRRFPWCGDLMQTAFKLSLPNEPFLGRVGQNPYLARNWLTFGAPTEAAFGAVGVFWRGSRGGIEGHVAAVIGRDPVRGRLRIRGGNQSNSVSDTWIEEDRLLGYRWPVSYIGPKPPLPNMNSAGAVVSVNEA